MNVSIAKISLCLLAGLVFVGCRNDATNVDQDATRETSTGKWNSENFDVAAALPQGWRVSHINAPGDTHDRPDGVVASFLNDSGPYSYIIRLENDPTSEQISNTDYLDAVRKQYDAHPAYTPVDEGEVDVHDRSFHRLRYKVAGTKKPNAMHIYIYRQDGVLVTLQMTFPLGDHVSMDLPEPLVSFDRGVTIDT